MSSKITISDKQRKLNKELHGSRSDFGSRSNAGGIAKHLPQALTRMHELGLLNSYLDYGCGKGSLVDTIREQIPSTVKISGYDPAVSKYSKYPDESVDILSCLDVLEHIELSLIDTVLDEIKSLTREFCFIAVDLQPAVKTLSDGRNAHIMLAPHDWWINKFSHRFSSLISFPINHTSGEFQKVIILGTNRPSAMKLMTSFALKLDIFNMTMTGGTLGTYKKDQ